MIPEHALYIGGGWRSMPELPALDVHDPSTGAVVGRVPMAGSEAATAAIEAADCALPTWAATPAPVRGAALRRWAELIEEGVESLAALLTSEQGKPLGEARVELRTAARMLAWFGEQASRITGELLPSDDGARQLVVTRHPVGVVGAITPWNFPASMIARKVGPAVAAGCTLVLKPAEATPMTALALAALASEAGVAPGVVNVVTGVPEPIGEVLTTDPRVRKLTFTGSTRVGKLLARRAADTVKRVSLELGGNCPFIVLEDADLDRAADGAIAARFRNAGQTCVSANRFLVHEDVHDRFVEAVVDRVANLVVGDGRDPATQIGPLINTQALDKVAGLVGDAVADGARVLVGGDRPEGVHYPPTVLVDVRHDMRIAREEIFGPVLAVQRLDSEDEAVRLANDTPYGLASYVYTDDPARAWRVAGRLEAGMVGANESMIATELAPFGGVKESGIGREGSVHGIDEYLELRYVCAGALA